MARKTKAAEMLEQLEGNNMYGYKVIFTNYHIRYAVIAATEIDAQKKVKALHPGCPIVYEYQANRIAL